MGARGPAPTDKRTLARRGSWRAKDRPDDLELELSGPAPPTTLTKEAKAEWRRVVPPLAAKGILAEVDRAGLTIMCEAWADYQRFGKLLADMECGSIAWQRVKSARHEAFQRWKDMAQRFGLTPADRPRIKLPEGAGAKLDDDKARFFRPRPVNRA